MTQYPKHSKNCITSLIPQVILMQMAVYLALIYSWSDVWKIYMPGSYCIK